MQACWGVHVDLKQCALTPAQPKTSCSLIFALLFIAEMLSISRGALVQRLLVFSGVKDSTGALFKEGVVKKQS